MTYIVLTLITSSNVILSSFLELEADDSGIATVGVFSFSLCPCRIGQPFMARDSIILAKLMPMDQIEEHSIGQILKFGMPPMMGVVASRRDIVHAT